MVEQLNKEELRLQPQNLEAEAAVLGGILMDSGAMDRVTSLLPPGSFYKEAHNRIYASMLGLQNHGEPIDTLTITNHLSKQGELEKAGGAYYLTGLVDALPSAANLTHYAEIVREKFILRQIIGAGHYMIEKAFESEEDSGVVLDKAEQNLFNLQQHSNRSASSDLRGILSDALAKLDAHHGRRGAYSGVPSGFKDLDELTDGFQPSDLVILAGRPSMGKTALALNIASNAATYKEHNYRVGVFSMEMSNYQLAMRFLTAQAGLDAHKVRKGTLSKREWPRLSRAASKLSEAPIFIDDTAGLDILELRSRIRRFKSDFDVDMVIIDYMQLLNSSGRKENRQQEMSDISRSLKAVARELDITVMALSQLSRAVEQRPGKDKRPIMSDLRESGAIEQDADVILFLYRPFVYSRAEEDEGKAEVIIAKQRNGPTDIVNLTFLKTCTTFTNAARDEFMAAMPVEDAPF